jgi:tetraacyldisaccharide 4'-kinase
VISIGNITVGGSGKTPITIHLAELLQKSGKRVAIVHSGYGRRDKQEYIVEPGKISDFTVDQIGDEISMMEARLSQVGFAVGANKKRMVKQVDEKFRPDAILIDDGFQRLDIEKDIDIVIISSNLLQQAAIAIRRLTCHLFPRGILREPLSSLERANVIYLIKENKGESDFSESLKDYNSAARIFPWTMSISGIEIDGNVEPLTALSGKRPCVFASIGSYNRLIRMLAYNAINISGDYNFGDHHQYKDQDYARLKRISDRHSADCYLTTAKDMVKLPPTGLDKPVYCLQLEVRPDDEKALNELIGMID